MNYNKMKRQLTILVMSLATAATALAQDNQLTIDAQIRTRGEYNGGAIMPRNDGEKAALFVNERARMSLGYKNQDIELKASVQHTGVWGQDGINQPNGRATMNEAWGKVKFGDGFFAQLGRQQLSYDDERILGAADWNVNGNWHDALRLGYESPMHKVHAIVAWNQNEENVRGRFYDMTMPYKTMQTLWYHFQAETFPIGVSVIGMNLGRESVKGTAGKMKFMQTVGTDITLKPANLDLHGAFYYQMGQQADGMDVQAWMASGSAAYTFMPELKLHAGYDYLSGNDNAGLKVKAFDALYGTHHKFYGAMDFFPGTLFTGLQDIQGGVTSQVIKDLTLQANYHCLMVNHKLKGTDAVLGHEVDFQFTARLKKDVTLMGGYSFMLGTEAMDVIKGGNHEMWQDWGWLQLNINPRILFR